MPVTLTELGIANSSLALPLFNSNLGTLTGVATTLQAFLDTTGSITNTGVSTSVGSGGVRSVVTVTSPSSLPLPTTITDPILHKLRLTQQDTDHVVAVGATVPLNEIKISRSFTDTTATDAATLAQFSSATPGATSAIYFVTTTINVTSFTGGNLTETRTTLATASLTVTYSFTDQVSTALTSAAATTSTSRSAIRRSGPAARVPFPVLTPASMTSSTTVMAQIRTITPSWRRGTGASCRDSSSA